MKPISHKGLFLLEMTLENVRCFQKATIDFRDQGAEVNDNRPARWTVILGENGTGKTTVLRSIVGMLPHPYTSQENLQNGGPTLKWHPFRHLGLRFWDPFSEKDRSGEISIKYLFQENIGEKDHKAIWFKLHHEKGVTFQEGDVSQVASGYPYGEGDECIFVCGYGASRKMVSEEGKVDGFLQDASLSLISDGANLTHPAALLKEIELLAANHPHFSTLRDRLYRVVLKVLPGISDFRFEYNKSVLGPAKVIFQTADGWVALDDLSLGYKTTIAWIVDFAFKLGIFYINSLDPLSEPAICLVDEIDLHMHPAWQRTIMKELSANFPNTQFVVTAHSPLIVQAAAEANANIVVLKRNSQGQVEVINDPIDVKHWRVDQILSSDLFGNLPSRLESDQELQEERWSLLAKKSLTKEERLRIEEIETLLSPLESQAEMDAQRLFKKLAKELKEIQDRERK